MTVMTWNYLLGDDGVVHLVSDFTTDDGMPYDLHEQVRAGENFCGVKYAALRAAKRGVLEIAWSRYAEWRAR